MAIVTSTLIMLSRGTPGVFVAGLAMLLMLLALVRMEAGWMTLAALLTIPFAYALGAWAGLLLIIRLLPILPLLSALAISNDEPLLAWILPAPSFFHLIYIVFTLVVASL